MGSASESNGHSSRSNGGESGSNGGESSSTGAAPVPVSITVTMPPLVDVKVRVAMWSPRASGE